MNENSMTVIPPKRLSHKQQRKLRRKLKRKFLRQKAAELRSLNEATELTEEEVIRAKEEEELEKQRHDEEERKWLERERIAQENFVRKKFLESSKQDAKDSNETATVPRVNSTKPSLQISGNNPNELLRRLREGIEMTSKNLPPNHRPEPPWISTLAAPLDYSRKLKDLCGFFWKTGACRYGNKCSRFHPLPPIDEADLRVLANGQKPCLVVVLGNMFNNFALRFDPLEVDESQLQSDFDAFYYDVRPELEGICQTGLCALRCCRNAAEHLRGNVYVQFSTGGSNKNEEVDDTALALTAVSRLNGRWYAGRQISARLAYLGGGWRGAICGLHLRGRCLKGDAECNFMHVFTNPRENKGDILAALNRGLAELPLRRSVVAARRSRSRSRSRDSRRRPRERSRRSDSSRSESRRRRRKYHEERNEDDRKRHRKHERRKSKERRFLLLFLLPVKGCRGGKWLILPNKSPVRSLTLVWSQCQISLQDDPEDGSNSGTQIILQWYMRLSRRLQSKWVPP